MIRNCWLGVSLLVWLASAGAISAQEGGTPDRLFEIDDFKGLNLYQEETRLEIGEALLAENIQFLKPGTISVLGGLQKRDSLVGTDKILGIGSLFGWSPDTSRIMIARDSFLFATPTTTIGFVPAGAIDPSAAWVYANTSRLVQDTSGRGRAAEFYRPGWGWNSWNGATLNTTKRIDYISDNNTFYLTDSSQLNDTNINALIWPIVKDHDARVRFVPIEVNGAQRFLILQAGMEPMISDGTTYNTRYFGVADSGTVQKTGRDTNGVCWLVDNTKVGVYARNEMANAGYWLHTPYNFTETDSSHWGRIWQIDSNAILDTGNVSEFRIWFTPGDTLTAVPSGPDTSAWIDSLRGSRYQLISAPFLRDVVTSAESPNAIVTDGGRMLRLATGTITARAYDHTPHVLTLTGSADTLIVVIPPDTTIDCWLVGIPGTTGYRLACETTVVTTNRLSASEAGIFGYAIRVVYTDTLGTDSTIIWTSGKSAATATGDFATSEWSVRRACIPFASDAVIYKDRLFLAGDPQDPNFVFYSDMNGARGPSIGAFPVDNGFHLPANGDVFVGFAQVYDWLLLFQREHTWLLKDDPIDGVLELALPDEGCIAPRSIIELENQVIYLSDKGWRVFDGNTAQDFALAIKPAVQAQPRVEYTVNQAYKTRSASTYDPTTGNVWMCMPFGTDTSNSGSFLYNFVDGSLSYSNEIYGDNAYTFPFNDTLRTVFTNKGLFFTYGYTDSLDVTGVDRNKMVAKWSSGWLDMGSKYKQKKISDGVLHVSLSSPNSSLDSTRRFYTRLYRDFDSLPFYADTVNVVGVVGGKHYEVESSVRLEPRADSATVEWLRVEIEGSGLNLMDVRGLALRFNDGADVFRDRFKAIRP